MHRTGSWMAFVHAMTWFGGAAALLGALLVAWSVVADRLLGRPLSPPAGDPGRFTSVDGVRTYYRVAGHGSAIPILYTVSSCTLAIRRASASPSKAAVGITTL